MRGYAARALSIGQFNHKLVFHNRPASLFLPSPRDQVLINFVFRQHRINNVWSTRIICKQCFAALAVSEKYVSADVSSFEIMVYSIHKFYILNKWRCGAFHFQNCTIQVYFFKFSRQGYSSLAFAKESAWCWHMVSFRVDLQDKQ